MDGTGGGAQRRVGCIDRVTKKGGRAEGEIE